MYNREVYVDYCRFRQEGDADKRRFVQEGNKYVQ